MLLIRDGGAVDGRRGVRHIVCLGRLCRAVQTKCDELIMKQRLHGNRVRWIRQESEVGVSVLGLGLLIDVGYGLGMGIIVLIMMESIHLWHP